ncbi:hypothetical protein [Bacillus niameyensis]|uniref:hypothetical protein n=1 Tax=Bacillus niameyensis TaxID=1522308 RepID=UPI0008411470|nr:hypothetical protein [Bacillus niameyensis]
MKRFFIVASLFACLLVVFSACDSSKEVSDSTANNQSQEKGIPKQIDSSNGDDSNSTQMHENTKQEDNKKDSNAETDQTTNENSSLIGDDKESKEELSEYSSEEIEYARVWLQLGPNQELDELNVRHISAGEQLNPNDATSANYPENVIQLAGSRLVDGSVTYSSNGDGTVNVYNVPLRWDSESPAGEELYTELIENTKLVSIDPGDDEDILELIEVLNIYD